MHCPRVHATPFPGPRTARMQLFLALVFVILPLAGTIDLWVFLLFLASIAVRAQHRSPSRMVCHPATRSLVFLGGTATIFARRHTLLGLEAGLSLLVLLLALKCIEARTERDFSVIASLGCFMCVSGLFLSQALSSMLYQIAVMGVFLSALAALHGAAPRVIPCLALAARILITALLPAMVIFFFVPRQGASFRLNLSGKDFSLTGMSDSLSAGSLSQAALSADLAFRVDFPASSIPPLHELYWRVNALYEGDGFNWSRGGELPSALAPKHCSGSRDVLQRIVLEPHGAKWMPALDRPVSRPRATDIDTDQILTSLNSIYLTARYEVVSRVGGRDPGLNTRNRRLLTRTPPALDQRILDLAISLQAPTTSETIRRIMRYFRTGGFTYTLSPGAYQTPDAMSDFLFNRKRGFCEHYAAACATLLRAAGVPSRIILGFQGGEMNNVGNYVTVRQSDAHAWCEAWTDEIGWVRVDPTTVVAPDRISSGIEGFLSGLPEAQRGFAGFFGRVGVGEILKAVRLLWDNLDYQWSSNIVSFDDGAQTAMMAMAGVAQKFHQAALWLVAVAGIVMCVIALRAMGARRPRHKDPARNCYDDVRAFLGKRGIPSASSDGPIAYFERSALTFPDVAEHLRRFANWYAQARYAGRQPSSHAEGRRLAKSIKRALRL